MANVPVADVQSGEGVFLEAFFADATLMSSGALRPVGDFLNQIERRLFYHSNLIN